jgi:Ankyrin repeat
MLAGMSDMTRVLVAIAGRDHRAAVSLIDVTPSSVTARLARSDEFFLAERLAQVYEGDTALHAAAFSYDPERARELVTRGANVRARNRRGAEPLHAAVIACPRRQAGIRHSSGLSSSISSRRALVPTQPRLAG